MNQSLLLIISNQIIEIGKSIGANIFINYGPESIVGFYKIDGHCYQRPWYTKIDYEGKIDYDNNIKIGYKKNLENIYEYNYTGIHKGYWFVADSEFSWGNQDYKHSSYYNKTINLNDEYELPETGWEDVMNILKIQ